jgi:hypothetical protein
MITLKKLQIANSLSEETLAYTADVYWEGRSLGYIRNDGGGGFSIFHVSSKGTKADYEAAQAFAKTQTQDLGEGYGIVPFEHLEDYVDYVAGQEGDRQSARRWLARTMKSTIVLLADGKIYTCKAKWEGDTARIEQQLKARHPGAVILNPLSEEEAIAKYLSAA